MSPILEGAAFGWLLLAVVAAVITGFVLGRRRLPWRRPRLPRVRGMNYLLNETPDPELDAVLAGLEARDDTVRSQLALGMLVRRRGEVDKAIRVHQTVLARPGLATPLRDRVEFELACDYLAAGLLNRAESLLLPLAGGNGELRTAAREQLLEVYQRGRDWQAAAAVARELVRAGMPELRRSLAHHLCALAERARDGGEGDAALRWLDAALSEDPNCVRASMLAGRMELAAGRYREAVRRLEQVRVQDLRFLPEVLPDLIRAHAQLGTDRDLIRFLERSVAAHPSAALASHLADCIARRSGPAEARDTLARIVARHPTVRGLNTLLSRLDGVLDGAQADLLRQIERVTAALLEHADPYVCDRCGFSGRVLHWQCPGCKAWGTTAPSTGLLGD